MKAGGFTSFQAGAAGGRPDGFGRPESKAGGA